MRLFSFCSVHLKASPSSDYAKRLFRDQTDLASALLVQHRGRDCGASLLHVSTRARSKAHPKEVASQARACQKRANCTGLLVTKCSFYSMR
ncbi:hypothetical protein DOTSEDRAFT_70485 [Dothistroma septosporum NZE10]|uniref:Uncharacterized protein n=1 Tax=Dothistroma septosporum (strain NZE10 / CBS 128990) TaxID=675120 RepID=N1PSY7_DOTSN|nr:hypothetical protein DOTSEDRAFT_70485 [Dothistroma septosporum NZE10]